MARGRDSGFTLMELMVAMGLTVAALGIALAAINGLSAMRETASMLTDGNQSLRASLNLMTRDLIVTGRQIPLGGISIPSGAGALPVVRPSPTGTTLYFPAAYLTLPSIAPADGLGPDVNGTPTDMVTVMMQDTSLMCGTTPLEMFNVAIAPDASSVTLDPMTQIGCAAGGIKVGDLVMILDTLQMVTAVNGQSMEFAAGDPMRLNQPGAAVGTLFSLRDTVTGLYPPAVAYRVIMISYYIDTTTNPARPQLMRRQNLWPDAAIGIGVENLQISYDLYDSLGGPVNVNVSMPPSPNEVRKINVFVSGRSRRPSTQSRQFLRTSLSTQISLRNLSFVNRYK